MAFLLYFFLARLLGELSKKSNIAHHLHALVNRND